jgi:hypothetical protein
MSFSVKVLNHQSIQVLNICDSNLLEKDVIEGKLKIHISKSYYCERFVEKEEAENLLKKSSSINMVGKKTVSLSISLGIGSSKGVKEINGVPFLLIFKM